MDINNMFDTKLFIKSFDILVGNNDLLYITMLVIFYSIIFHTYLISQNKIRVYYSKIKDEKIFIRMLLDNTMLAVFEQACYVIYGTESLKFLGIKRHMIRVIISLVYCILHTMAFNLFYETFTIAFQVVTSFYMMMVYLKNNYITSLLLNTYSNAIWIAINYIIYKILLTNRIFHRKSYITPINIDNDININNSDININSSIDLDLSKPETIHIKCD